MIQHILKLIWNKKGSNALMILEIFLSFIVLFFVLAYVFFNLEKIRKPLGFATENRWMINLDGVDSKDSLDIISTMENLDRNLLSLEEIQQISFTESIAPFKNNQWRNGNDDNGFSMNALMVPVDFNLAATMDMSISEGRWFTEEDLIASIPPILVNKEFILKYYPDKSMVDSMFIIDGDRRIIGIVDEYRYLGEFSDPEACIFLLNPYTDNQSNILLKIAPDTPASFEEKLSSVVNSAIGTTGSTIENLAKEKKNNSRESWLMLIALMSICIFLCLNVALGLFGVLWYNISKRKSEIGLRQALGAHGSDITKQFILEILILTGIAIALGIFFTIQVPLLKMTEYPAILFYKAIIYASLIILTLVFICALFPSLQASRITPATSLHED